jgi:Tfp pilus assembly protein PilF
MQAGMLAAALLFFAPAGGAFTQELYNKLVVGYQQLVVGDNEAATATFIACLKMSPGNIEARRYLAHAYLRSGLAVQAAVQFDIVLKMAPGAAHDLSSLGDAYFYTGNYDWALQCYNAALEKDEKLDIARTGMVHTYVALGDNYRAGAICLQEISKKDNQNNRAVYEQILKNLQEDPEKAPPVKLGE